MGIADQNRALVYAVAGGVGPLVGVGVDLYVVASMARWEERSMKANQRKVGINTAVID